MEPIYLGRHRVHRDGRDLVAEIEARFRPQMGGPGVGFSGGAERFLNATFAADRITVSNAIWHATRRVIERNGRRLARWPGIRATTFTAQVVAIRVTPGLPIDEAAALLAEAAREAAEAYFAAVADDPIHAEAPDPERPFAHRPEPGFDDAFVARRPCFLEYATEDRPSYLFASQVSRYKPIDDLRRERVLTPNGISALRSAVHGYLLGCRPEAEVCLAGSIELLKLADATGEVAAGDSGGGWGLGHRYAALAFGRWLRTGEPQPEAIERA